MEKKISETKLLTPDDEIIKARIASKLRIIPSNTQIQKKQENVLNCKHLSICYSKKELYFKCKDCGRKLIFCNIQAYEMFCGYLGIPFEKFLEN